MPTFICAKVECLLFGADAGMAAFLTIASDLALAVDCSNAASVVTAVIEAVILGVIVRAIKRA